MLDEAQIEAMKIWRFERVMDPGHPASIIFSTSFTAMKSGDPNKVLFHSLGHWRLASSISWCDLEPLLFGWQASNYLWSSGFEFWHRISFLCKPAHHGGMGWHQDYSYWTSDGCQQQLDLLRGGLDDATGRKMGMSPIRARFASLGLAWIKPALAGEKWWIDGHELDPKNKRAISNRWRIRLRLDMLPFTIHSWFNASFANFSPKHGRLSSQCLLLTGPVSDILMDLCSKVFRWSKKA